jgi:hypothetical protein
MFSTSAATTSGSLTPRQNQGVNYVDLLDRARKGYQIAGRGMVVLLRGDEEPRYAPIEEAKESLAKAEAEPDLLAAVIYATGKYDPRWEAVLFLEEGEGFIVYIVRHNGAEVIGGVGWTAIN